MAAYAATSSAGRISTAVSVSLLDSSGRRIGEKGVFVTPAKQFQPGQVEKFSVEDKVSPAGWSGKVEAQVVDIDFAQ